MQGMTGQSPPRSSKAASRFLAAAGLVALLGGMAFIVMGETGDDGGTTAAPATTTTATAPPPVKNPPAATRIVVTGVGAYDPEGDQSENGGDARLATDGNATTAWKTEHYRTTFRKSGVGLVLDAGRPVKASRVVVTTETPGYAAQVQVGNSSTGPFSAASGSKTTTARTTFALKPRRGRYVVVWITSMPADGVAAVNEVRVTAGG
jgi:F5/8 type C domain